MSIESLDPVEPSFPCPEPGCDRVFPSKAALQGHGIAHRPVTPCPECGKEYKTPAALGNHRAKAHGVESAYSKTKSGKSKRPNPIPSWQADDIFQTAIRILWPAGDVPVESVLPLIEWREDTRAFLEKIS